MSLERKGAIKQELKESDSVQMAKVKINISDGGRAWRAFHRYRSRYLGVVSHENDRMYVFDCSSAETMREQSILRHPGLIAIGELHHSETLFTVSKESIKFWNKSSLATHDRVIKPTSEFAFETPIDCGSLVGDSNYGKAKLDVLPDDNLLLSQFFI